MTDSLRLALYVRLKDATPAAGNLYRLNLDGFNLSCAWPGDLLGQFTQLATLSLSNNPYLKVSKPSTNIPRASKPSQPPFCVHPLKLAWLLRQGNTSAVFGTVANLTALHFLDLSGDSGINGTIDSGTSGSQLCMSAQVRICPLL